ncbi:hypothetical protein C0R09_11525 [Brevibacillus laterosporus]|uniref:hypothetical protein n=1 Tax=Brevibacillus TaxID=55080 RepID=UPI000C764A21|nr:MULTISPECIES: hypothetical protein [Brevibacillus]AUM65108.1 hypothetical protein C0R09_11525 [Brevibacillus laterosporus]MBA4532960.1 hypothetical protein [Brevibacillus halotolerans]
MFIKFDEYELLELFCKEPIVLHEKETGMYIYSKQDKHGFNLQLYLSVFENVCTLSLTHKDLEDSIFEFELIDVESIRTESDLLIIRQSNSHRDIPVKFKPNFSLEIQKFK